MNEYRHSTACNADHTQLADAIVGYSSRLLSNAVYVNLTPVIRWIQAPYLHFLRHVQRSPIHAI